MAVRGEVLVAILNNRLDFNLAYEQETINYLGGLAENSLVSRKLDLKAPPGSRQLGLFDNW